MNTCDQSLIQYLDRSFKVLIENNQDVFWITNADYSLQLYVSPAYEKIWGCPAATLFENPLNWLNFIHPEDKTDLSNQKKMPHSQVKEPYLAQYRIVRPDGAIRWIEDHTFPIYEDGLPVGYAGIAKEITAAKQLADELLIANNFLPKFADRMEHIAFWVRDPSLKKQLYLSKGFEKIWGRPTEFLYRNPDAWLETILPEDRQRDRSTMLSTLEEEGIEAKYVDVFRIQRPSGEVRWIKDVSFPIFDSNGVCVGFAGIGEDITAEKLSEMDLKRAKERAEEANISKANFIASMSHDFRTPLNGILGFAEILRSRVFYPEQKEFIEGIIQAGNALLNLVEEILNFISLDLNKIPVKENWFNLKQLIQDIILVVTPQAHEKKLELVFSYPSIIPEYVVSDVNRMRRIITNLINNAIKFTHQGHVMVCVELLRQEHDLVWLQIIVEDTGIGIAKENFEFIFGSFNRVDPSYRGRYKGSGFGLTIVKQFVEDLGGRIYLNSELDHGSRFYANIPFKLKPFNSNSESNDHFSELKILVIVDCVTSIKSFLGQFGLRQTHFVTSEEALDKIQTAQEQNAPYQVIIVDDELEHFDPTTLGLSLMEKENVQPYLIAMLEARSPYTFQQLKRAGFSDCMTKPLQSSVVIKALEDAYTSLLAGPRKQNLDQLESIHVLLVEDNVLTLKGTTWMLEELECKVDIAENGAEAIQLLDNPYNVIFLDVGLPDMDGIELAKVIRSTKNQNVHTPIVALTAHVLERDREKCLSAGMNEFLKKPLFKNDLKRLLLKIM